MRHSAMRGRDHAPRDRYAEVTNQVIAALEAGAPPWRQQWDPDKAGGPMLPQNATTGARYRGVNVLTLGMSPLAFASGDPRWATYKQAVERGWQVRKGSHGTTGFFYKPLAIEVDGDHGDPTRDHRWIPLLRAFTLFHASQIDGLPPYVAPDLEEAPWRAPEAAETIVANSGAVIRIGGDRAFYSPSTDHVQMPPKHAFRSPEAWSSVVLHELAHLSGARDRLNRDLTGRFGSQAYAREELRAELAQVTVCAELGIADCEFTNGVAYIESWLKTLRGEKREVFRAAADAQRIADYLLAFHPAYVQAQQAEASGHPETALKEAA